MADNVKYYVKTADGSVYGPAGVEKLIEWAKDGRLEPTSFYSYDRISWTPVQLLSELQMKWLVETKPGKVFGPFTREVVSRISREGNVPEGSKIYRLYEYAIDDDPPPKIVEKEVRVEVPVEKIVEKPVEVIKEVEKIVEKEVRVEVPVEKIVEKIVEKEVRVEVPVEKIVEKIVEVEKPVEVIKEVIKEVPVPEPAREVVVVPEVVEPVDIAPPPVKSPGSIFDGMDRSKLQALEAAARREIARSRGGFGFFGGKRK